MNVTIDLAKKYIKNKPNDADILRASLIKVIRLYEEQEKQLLIHSVVVPKGTLPKSDAEITKQALKNYGTGQRDCIYEQKTAYVKGAIDYRDNKIEPI